MPPQNKRKKASGKSKPQALPQSQRPSLRAEVDGVRGWDAVARIICDRLQLPDSTSRSGLKKVHADFDEIYSKLDGIFQEHQGDERIMGGVVHIYSEFCTDSILRNKLFERGFLNKLIPMLDLRACFWVALDALRKVTHHGGVTVKLEVAQHWKTLIRLINEHRDDPNIAESVIMILSHSLSLVGGGETPTHPRLLRSLDLPSIFNAVIESLKHPEASRTLLDHAVVFLGAFALNCSAECKRTPSVLNLLVAGLRSKDWNFRCNCLAALIHLHWHEAEIDRRQLSLFIGTNVGGVMGDAMDKYGRERCEINLTLRTAFDFRQAMEKCGRDHDLYSLGLTLAQLIPRTELSISEGFFNIPELPFRMWTDSLPECAKAIRAKGVPNERDLADILDLKFWIMKGRTDYAVEVAKGYIQRSPNVAYFYYVASLVGEHSSGLQYAKKGMKCSKITPFLRFQMMQRAVDHAGHLGVFITQDEQYCVSEPEESMAHIASGLEDAATYIAEAPPDSWYLKSVLQWQIVLTLLNRGGDISKDLREVKDSIERLRIADKYSKDMGLPLPKTVIRLTQQLIVKLYTGAVDEWDEVINRSDNPSGDGQLADDISRCLSDIHVENGAKEHVHDHSCSGSHAATVRKPRDSALYQCSWCRNPSAVLRKCSGCGTTRYCDGECQKAHWIASHKRICKAAAAKKP